MNGTERGPNIIYSRTQMGQEQEYKYSSGRGFEREGSICMVNHPLHMFLGHARLVCLVYLGLESEQSEQINIRVVTKFITHSIKILAHTLLFVLYGQAQEAVG